VTDCPAAHDRSLWHAGGASEGFAYDRHLCVMLGFRRHVLPVATTAAVCDMATRRLDTIGGCREDAQHASTSEVALHFDELGLDRLAGQRTVDEHHATVIVARESVSPGDEPFDAQLAACADGGIGAAHRHRP
jgi:hypothetical protein